MGQKLKFEVQKTSDPDCVIIHTSYDFKSGPAPSFVSLAGKDVVFRERVFGLPGVSRFGRHGLSRYALEIHKGRVFAWEDILPRVEQLLREHAGEAS